MRDARFQSRPIVFCRGRGAGRPLGINMSIGRLDDCPGATAPDGRRPPVAPRPCNTENQHVNTSDECRVVKHTTRSNPLLNHR